METTTRFYNETDRAVSDILDDMSDDAYELKYWVNEYDHGQKTNSVNNAEALSNIRRYLKEINDKMNRVDRFTRPGVKE